MLQPKVKSVAVVVFKVSELFSIGSCLGSDMYQEVDWVVLLNVVAANCLFAEENNTAIYKFMAH